VKQVAPNNECGGFSSAVLIAILPGGHGMWGGTNAVMLSQSYILELDQTDIGSLGRSVFLPEAASTSGDEQGAARLRVVVDFHEVRLLS
jgi:hypothetical protein